MYILYTRPAWYMAPSRLPFAAPAPTVRAFTLRSTHLLLNVPSPFTHSPQKISPQMASDIKIPYMSDSAEGGGRLRISKDRKRYILERGSSLLLVSAAVLQSYKAPESSINVY